MGPDKQNQLIIGYQRTKTKKEDYSFFLIVNSGIPSVRELKAPFP